MSKKEENLIANISQIKRWKIAGITIGAIILIPLLLFLGLDLYDRHSFATVQDEFEKVQNDVMMPAGAASHTAAYYRGGGFLDNLACGPDVSCPNGTREWFVPIEPGKAGDFTLKVLRSEGYTVKDAEDGTKGKLQMTLTVNPIGNTTPPSPVPPGKEWDFVRVDVYYY